MITSKTKIYRLLILVMGGIVVSGILLTAYSTGSQLETRSEKPDTWSQQANGVAHFLNPPTFDSGWVNITDKCGKEFSLLHELNTTEYVVDVRGKQTLTSEEHQVNYGGTSPPGWLSTYGGADHEIAYSLIQTDDHGYAIVGEQHNQSDINIWLVKTDPLGNMEWNQTYGGANQELHGDVVQTDDGGYAITAYSNATGVNWDFWLVKTDAAGNMLWNKTYGGIGPDYSVSLVHTNDKGYVMAGHTRSFGAGQYDFYVVKTDATGNMEWNQTYGGANADEAKSIIQTSDGGYAIAGWTTSFSVGSSAIWVVKTDSLGNMQWNKTYEHVNQHGYGSYIVETLDGGYAVVGHVWGGETENDCWLVKTDSAGNMEWNQTYGGNERDDFRSIDITDDGGYVMAGNTRSFGAQWEDVWIVKVDQSGDLEWSRTYDGPYNEGAESVVQTEDGGYAMAGFYLNINETWFDFWATKVSVGSGLALSRCNANTSTFYRYETDLYWNYLRLRAWLMEEPTWQYGDLDMDGDVDIYDIVIAAGNYGKTYYGTMIVVGGTGLVIIGSQRPKKTKPPKPYN